MTKAQTALFFAILLDRQNIIDFLLRAKVDPNILGKMYARLHLAIQKGNYDLTSRLLENGAFVNQEALPTLATPLHYACAGHPSYYPIMSGALNYYEIKNPMYKKMISPRNDLRRILKEDHQAIVELLYRKRRRSKSTRYRRKNASATCSTSGSSSHHKKSSKKDEWKKLMSKVSKTPFF